MELYNYIPSSRIKQERNREIRKLQLPEDIINKIIGFSVEFIKPDNGIDSFWINLGKETCNLYQWSYYIYKILQNSFGKKKFEFVFNKIYTEFISLRHRLDDLVCEYYPLSITTINDISIVSIFSSNSDIIEYPILHIYNRKKYINENQRVYITTFIERINQYYNFIYNNIDKLVEKYKKQYIKKQNICKINRDIIKTIKEIKKNCNRLAIMMNDIEVKE